MLNFCTLFDSNYLTRGLALFQSLRDTCSSFHLYVVAFNDECYAYLNQAKLPGLTPISLQDFEDDELLKIKPTRTAAEYCWTCTPSILLYSIKKYNLPSCIYIDADMFFYSDPRVLFEEMGEKSIVLTEHHYTPEYDQSLRSGKFCVQYMFFKHNTEAIAALTWWRERCIEWCYARVEAGKFGDQKYLDDWPHRFPSVHILKHRGGGVAPWNVQQYFISTEQNTVMLTNKKSGKRFPLVFYHFHGVKFYTDDVVSCCGPIYEISTQVKEQLYYPYFNLLRQIEKKLTDQQIAFNVNGAKGASPGKRAVLRDFIRDRLLLLKSGQIGLTGLKLQNFTKNHFHFYKLTNRFHGNTD